MWFIFATVASVLWGLTYVLDEQLYRHISVPTTLALHSIAAAIIVSLYAVLTGSLKADITALGSSNKLLWIFFCAMATFIVAELFIGFSITYKNASLAGLIEISYPLFIALFAYLLFKESELSIATALGGVLILLGVVVIYWFAR